MSWHVFIYFVIHHTRVINKLVIFKVVIALLVFCNHMSFE